jgi:hypothetical protein
VLAREDQTRHNKPRQNKADTNSDNKSAKEETRKGGGFKFESLSSPPRTHPPPPPSLTASHHPEKRDLKKGMRPKTKITVDIWFF